MNIRLTIAACCTAVGLAGCTNLPDAQDYSTSLGASQQQMREDPEWSAGRVWVRPGPAQASHHLRGVRDADALVELPEGELDWPIGRIVRVHRLRDWMQP